MTVLRLKELLKEKGITGKELAERVSLTETSLSRIVKGDQQPRFDLLLQIAQILDVDIRDLFYPTKDDGTPLNGYLEFKGEVYKISNTEDLERVSDTIKNESKSRIK